MTELFNEKVKRARDIQRFTAEVNIPSNFFLGWTDGSCCFRADADEIIAQPTRPPKHEIGLEKSGTRCGQSESERSWLFFSF